MKCLSVCQPWAWAIMHGPKRVENRTWGTHYRGPLLIHAGKSRDYYDREDPGEWRRRYGIELPAKDRLAWGAILGQVELAACVEVARADSSCHDLTPDQIRWLKAHPFTEGPFCWIIKAPKPFPQPIPYRGAQGLFHVPIEVIQLPTRDLATTDRPAPAGKQPWLFG